MKVITEPDEIVLEAACHYCHGHWEATVVELKLMADYSMSGEYPTTDCPGCMHKLKWSVKRTKPLH